MTTELTAEAASSQTNPASGIFRDYLTGIANRQSFEHELEQRLGLGECTTVLLLDLDRFKAVNDSLGHAVGDSLLCLVANRMASSLGTGDLLARLGGDEFGIIADPRRDAGQLASVIVELLQRTYLIDGVPVDIGVSIGIAHAPGDAQERPKLMKCADLALYQAKAAGRNCFVYFVAEMEVRGQEKRALEVALRKAVTLRQLELHYRPQIDVQSNRLSGLEALLHWKHPKLGLLEAAAFMPLAEEIGIVVPIGEWVTKAVCREVSRWSEDVTVAVMVSARQFESARYFEVVKSALETAGISGKQLELEVTEAILLRDGKAVLTMLDKLRSIGVRVAINSFGRGIASLGQMVEFPMDKIKIDRSLVQEDGTGIKERAIVRAIAALGASLGITTLAEGVNTPEHLARIQMDGCTAVQGYLVSKAFPSSVLRDQVDKLLSPLESHSTEAGV